MIAYAGNIDAVSEPARRRNYGVFYNGVNGRDGLYNQFVFKGFLSGESFADINSGDVEETLSFIGSMVVPYFSSSQKVQSGVFRYVPEASGAAAAFNEGSSTLVTLFYPSASLGNGPSGSYTGSFIGFSSSLTAGGVRMRSGSHLFLDRFLTTPASAGFYYIPGTNSPKVVLGAFKGFNSTFNSVPFVLPNDSSVSSPSSSVLLGNNREEVPRWASKSLH